MAKSSSSPPADLLIRHADLLTCAGPAPLRGPEQARVGHVPDASVASENGRIVFVGPSSRDSAHVAIGPATRLIDADGAALVPGFVDPHTHVVFAGDRRGELRRRLAGATYAEIAAEGGGILQTVEETRRATEETLVIETATRLREMLACGTTTCEAKSGYGLTTPTELKMLRAIRRLDAEQPIDLAPTFLGAHQIPPEYRARRTDYIELIVGEMIPAVARDRLAEWCDVFCESGVFDCEESRRILEAGKRAGLRPRIHADELASSGGWRVATEVGARSADHLLFVDRAAAGELARAGVVATLLPIAAFYLKLGRFAPARMLIDAGVPVALATDVNPGGGHSPSMPFAMALACFQMGMTFEEALVAATINAAYVLDRHERIGSLEPGKAMDAVLVRGEAIELVRVGAPAIMMVIKNGAVVAPADHAPLTTNHWPLP